MAIKMVREPSETPNINNIDDIVPMRYAYGNQNGYVIGKGNEISNTVNGLNFTVNSGRLVLQGVECDIDASGVTVSIDNIATKRYYIIYLEVNLGLNTATIKDEYDTATYPTIDVGDDLTENTTGIARLLLYRFTATSGIISEVNKVVESVKYIDESFIKNVKVDNAVQADNADNSINATNASYISKLNYGVSISNCVIEINYNGSNTSDSGTKIQTFTKSLSFNGVRLQVDNLNVYYIGNLIVTIEPGSNNDMSRIFGITVKLPEGQTSTGSYSFVNAGVLSWYYNAVYSASRCGFGVPYLSNNGKNAYYTVPQALNSTCYMGVFNNVITLNGVVLRAYLGS